MGQVYVITNKLNGKQYVGITKYDIGYRLKCHFKGALVDGYQTVFANAIRKYGKEVFIAEVLFDSDDVEELYELEKLFIETLNTRTPFGYNMTDGGEGGIGSKRSAESRAKMSKAQLGNTKTKGKKMPETSSQKLRERWHKYHLAEIERYESVGKYDLANAIRQKLTSSSQK